VEDFGLAFGGDARAHARLVDGFRSLVEPLVEDGVDVIVPAGALPALLFAREHGFAIGGALVVNCVAVGLKEVETAVKLRVLTGLGPSRGPSFAPASPEAVEDFRRFVAEGRQR
jgi:hypothetical protein